MTTAKQGDETRGASCRNLARAEFFREQRGRWAALMRINIWIILAALLALLVITRYLQQDRDTQRICADDPSASACQRGVAAGDATRKGGEVSMSPIPRHATAKSRLLMQLHGSSDMSLCHSCSDQARAVLVRTFPNAPVASANLATLSPLADSTIRSRSC